MIEEPIKLELLVFTFILFPFVTETPKVVASADGERMICEVKTYSTGYSLLSVYEPADPAN